MYAELTGNGKRCGIKSPHDNRLRRGALMISMDCTHPDLKKFINVKNDLSKVNYANISVQVSDAFMEAVLNDGDWTLHFERPETGEHIEETVKAKEIYKLLCENNWNYAEPGILFWDTINNYNLLSNNEEYSYAGVNPCAEEPLPAGGSCLLGSMNLSAFVHDGEFDFRDFAKSVAIATRAMNTVQEEGLEKHPLQEQRDSAKNWRQIGLGIFGLADALIKLELPYGSDESIAVCNVIGRCMANAALSESVNLAYKLGTYPKYTPDVMDTEFFKVNASEYTRQAVEKFGLRNSQLLTIAPTGTLSTMLGVSGGIEPIFANYYTRTTKSLHGKDVDYKVYTPIVKEYMEKQGITDDKDLPEWFVTSADIPIKDRLNMQRVWQTHIDASISSTVNLPNEATVEDVENLYMTAWKFGLKGVTVYRAGCAREGILKTDTKKKNESTVSSSKKNIGLERHLTTGCGSLHVCAYFDEHGQLKNTYLSKGSTGGCNNFMIGLSRMISLAARNGVGIDAIIDQLNSSGTCPSYAVRRATKGDVSPGSCCPVAVGKALHEMWEEVNGISVTTKQQDESKVQKREEPIQNTDKCPECGGELKHEMGCVTCTNCGYSKCG